MSEHLTWCKSLQGGTAVDCNCEQARKWIVGEIATIAADNARLESENARLRKAIEAVIDMCPHDDTCPNHKLGRSGWAQRACCTCSKHDALEGK